MDIYSKAVEFFKKNPEKVTEVWDDPKSHWAGVLFQAVTPDGLGKRNEDGFYCGDLSEIRSSMAVAWNNSLQKEIMEDYRIPKIYSSNSGLPKISDEVLVVFAEWQRIIDKALGRDPVNFKVL